MRASLNTRQIRDLIYEKFGWSLAEWCRRRGFNYQVVRDAIQGNLQKAGSRRAEEVLRVLGRDLGLKLHDGTSSGRFSQDIGQSRIVKQKTRRKIASKKPEGGRS